MRPSEKIREQTAIAFGKNNELVLNIFQTFLEEIKFPEVATQTTIDMMFLSFTAGMCEVMSPNSDFNKKWQI
jgi:hypothetical protein